MGLLGIVFRKVSPALALGLRVAKFTFGIREAHSKLAVTEKCVGFTIALASTIAGYQYVIGKIVVGRFLSKRRAAKSMNVLLESEFEEGKDLRAIRDICQNYKGDDEYLHRAAFHYLYHMYDKYKALDVVVVKVFSDHGKFNVAKCLTQFHASSYVPLLVRILRDKKTEAKDQSTDQFIEKLNSILEDIWVQAQTKLKKEAVDFLLL